MILASKKILDTVEKKAILLSLLHGWCSDAVEGGGIDNQPCLAGDRRLGILRAEMNTLLFLTRFCMTLRQL